MIKMCLKDLTTVICNNDDCVVLKVESDSKIKLICLGCFNGDETMFRLTKGENVTCTVFRENGKTVSWNWGRGGFTLVSNNLRKAGQLIQNCIENDYGIKCQI